MADRVEVTSSSLSLQKVTFGGLAIIAVVIISLFVIRNLCTKSYHVGGKAHKSKFKQSSRGSHFSSGKNSVVEDCTFEQ